MSLATIFAFLGGLGGGEVTLILGVLILFFGAKKIPDIAKGLGKGIREFKDASQGIVDSVNAPPPAPVQKEITE